MDNRSLPDSQSIFATELLFLLHFRFSVGGVHQVRRNTLDVYRIITKVLAFCVSAFSAHITFRGDVIPPVMKNSLKGYWIDAYGHHPHYDLELRCASHRWPPRSYDLFLAHLRRFISEFRYFFCSLKADRHGLDGRTSGQEFKFGRGTCLADS